MVSIRQPTFVSITKTQFIVDAIRRLTLITNSECWNSRNSRYCYRRRRRRRRRRRIYNNFRHLREKTDVN